MPYKDKQKNRDYQREWARRKRMGLNTRIVNKPNKPKKLLRQKEKKYCVVCNKELIGRQRRFCSKRCTSKYWMPIRRNMLKQKAVDYKGGKCEICGYSKCLPALVFHHLDPSKKDFQLSAQTLKTNKWEQMEKELDKCILLCANCHAEVHWGKI